MENWTDYGFAPLDVISQGGARPAPKHQFSLVTTARWETPYIVEWISYHLSIGFDHIYIYCNDDNPEEMFEAVFPFTVGNTPKVTFRHYGVTGAQFQMFFHFLRHYSTETEWIMFLDVDEFLCLKNTNNIGKFIEKYTCVDALYFNWSFFGNNNHKIRPKGSVLKNYTRREDGATPFTKILVRSTEIPYRKVFLHPSEAIHHNLLGLAPDLKAVNVLGDSLKGYYDNFPHQAWSYLKEDGRNKKIIDIAFIAHYNIKSEQDFDIRSRRSISGNYVEQSRWGSMSRSERDKFLAATNAVFDPYLKNYWSEISNPASCCVFPLPEWPLISEGCLATQSSVLGDMPVEENAEGPLSGQIPNFPAHHTACEDNPWWRVDLGKVARIHEIRLFNRLDDAIERSANLEISVSDDDNSWVIIHRKDDNISYGGADGSPYIWRNEEGVPARFVKITLLGQQIYLHFCQVQVFGIASW